MKQASLDDMTRGWFIGNFEPSLLKTEDVEVAIKRFQAGDYEEKHYHKIATEYTVIISGEVKMFDQTFTENDIIVVEPNEATDFLAVKDSVLAVIKLPGASHDKYLMEENK